MIVNLTPDVGVPANQLCAGRLYIFEDQGMAITYEWVVDSKPASVDIADIDIKSPNGRRTIISVPQTGDYCFSTRQGVPV